MGNWTKRGRLSILCFFFLSFLYFPFVTLQLTAKKICKEMKWLKQPTFLLTMRLILEWYWEIIDLKIVANKTSMVQLQMQTLSACLGWMPDLNGHSLDLPWELFLRSVNIILPRSSGRAHSHFIRFGKNNVFFFSWHKCLASSQGRIAETAELSRCLTS